MWLVIVVCFAFDYVDLLFVLDVWFTLICLPLIAFWLCYLWFVVYWFACLLSLFVMCLVFNCLFIIWCAFICLRV